MSAAVPRAAVYRRACDALLGACPLVVPSPLALGGTVSGGAVSGGTVSRGTVSGGTVWSLGDYMDEVDRQFTAFDAWVRALEQDPGPATDHLSQGFFLRWHLLMDASPWLLEPTSHRPSGWRAFYAEHRGFLIRVWSDEPLWALTERFEDELVRQWDWAIECGATPPIARPLWGHQPPPPEKTAAGKAEKVLGWVAVIAAIAAAGYALRGLGGVLPGR
ncbi:MAG: hypothetical protein RIF41_27960 [Polyangiaceae bacterium]